MKMRLIEPTLALKPHHTVLLIHPMLVSRGMKAVLVNNMGE